MVKVLKTHWYRMCALSMRPLISIAILFVLALPCAFYDYDWLKIGFSLKPALSKLNPFAPTYGPLEQDLNLSDSFYDFSKTTRGFHKSLPLKRFRELSKEQLHELILKGVPHSLGRKMKPHLATALYFSQKRGLDPLWVLSIMWVESHFKTSATSRVRAAGLMQIMPGTGQYLNRLLGLPLPISVSHHINYDPYRNIELGTYYLKKLHRRFGQRYDYATVAYNMGPTYTKRRLRRRQSVGRRNHYLNKVRKSYQRLAGPLKEHFLKTEPAYKLTYVYDRNALKLSFQVVAFHDPLR